MLSISDSDKVSLVNSVTKYQPLCLKKKAEKACRCIQTFKKIHIDAI